ncbi:MAG: hypothetical protein ACOC6R_03400 [Chloroflexota bacterium]|jgi:hypothetical protein
MEELLAYVEEYRREHSEIDSFLKMFEMARESYERYLALTTMPLPQTRPTSTTQIAYDANVSAVSGQY